MKIKLFIPVLLLLLTSMTFDKPAYQLFDVNGKKTTYANLLKDARECEVVLFGELHNNPISHWLELQLCKDLFLAKKQDLILGAEMFESDNQQALDEYLSGKIPEDTFNVRARFWPNYATDYRPLVEFARNTNLNFIASNTPRRYANLVFKKGFEALDSLPEGEKKLIAPIPITYDPTLDCYSKMLAMNMGGHASPNLPKSQALKDATMAHFIRQKLAPGKTVLHFNGSYHSDYFEGIMWYLKAADPYMKIITIATVEQGTLDQLSEEYIMLADYIIVVPDDMTKTYE